MLWHVSVDGVVYGPFEDTFIIQEVRRGAMSATALVSCNGSPWAPMLTVQPFASALGARGAQEGGGITTPQILGLLIGGAALFIGFMIWKHASTPTMTAADLPPAQRDEGNDVARTLVERYPIACQAVVGDWGACHDEPKSYDALVACTEKLIGAADAARARYPAAPVPAGCAAEADAAMRKFLEYHPSWLRENLAWFKANKAKLAPRLNGKQSFSDFCGGGEKGDPCLGKPTDEKVDWSVVNGIECTKMTLVCGEPDNVCWLAKATTRLGLECGSPGRDRRPVLSKATGKAVPY